MIGTTCYLLLLGALTVKGGVGAVAVAAKNDESSTMTITSTKSDNEPKHNNFHRRKLTGWKAVCNNNCRLAGKLERDECFLDCNDEYRKPQDNWQPNRVNCKEVCRVNMRESVQKCKQEYCQVPPPPATDAPTQAPTEYQGPSKLELCAECPCCAQFASFKNALLNGDDCAAYIGIDAPGFPSFLYKSTLCSSDDIRYAELFLSYFENRHPDAEGPSETAWCQSNEGRIDLAGRDREYSRCESLFGGCERVDTASGFFERHTCP